MQILANKIGPITEPDVVIIMGGPGAGKTTRAKIFAEAGYARLNRDNLGGKLRDLIPAMDELYQNGSRRFVLDNTYPLRSSRALVIAWAASKRISCRCIYVDTDIEQCKRNNRKRMYQQYGRILSADEIKNMKHPNAAPLVAFGSYRSQLERPNPNEGFKEIEVVHFGRFPPS